MPTMKFYEAIRDAFDVTMEARSDVCLVGVGLIDPRAVWDTIKGLLDKYGHDRVIEGPLAEQMLTGFAFGAALQGLRPVLIHHRVDFLPLTFDQIVNHAAKWSYMFGAQQSVPLVIRGVVGRGWGNGPQHTQSLHGLCGSVPGIKVVVPSNPQDAKGLMVSAILDNEPVIYIDHRWLHQDEGDVPAGLHSEPIGKIRTVLEGNDISLVAIGPMVQESIKAANLLRKVGVSVEVIDLRTVKPLDYEGILESVERTGRIIVADCDWRCGGTAAAIVSEVSIRTYGRLKAAPSMITWPEHPAPSSYGIEQGYYPMAGEIVTEIARILSLSDSFESLQSDKQMHGPF